MVFEVFSSDKLSILFKKSNYNLSMRISILIFILLQGLTVFGQDSLSVFPYAVKLEWGLIDGNKKVIVEPKYGRMEFTSGPRDIKARAVVRFERKAGLINREGKVLLPIDYDAVVGLGPHCEKLMKFKLGWKEGLVDIDTGRIVMEANYYIQNFIGHRKIAVAKYREDGRKFGAVNSLGKVLTEPDYVSVRVSGRDDEYPTVVLTEKGGKEIRIDAYEGKEVTAEMESGESFMNGFTDELIDMVESSILISAYTEGAKSGHVIECKTKFGKMNRDTIWGYKSIVGAKMKSETRDPSVLCLVAQNDTGWLGIIDADGNELCPFKYDEIRAHKKTRGFKLTRNYKSGLADSKGKLIYDTIFDRFSVYSKDKNYLFFENGDLKGYADLKGNIYHPLFAN
ncbi:MAG: hypothetical protein ACI9RM_000969 [Ulvibacter sp.]|jgi:hypothetical protein